MKEWWQSLEARQRTILAGAGLIMLALALFLWVWEPLAESRQAERERIAQQQALLDWLTALTPVARELRLSQTRSSDLGGRSLLGLADQTARAAGLAGALSRIEPAGDGQVRVWLDGAEFVATMGWLQRLSVEYPIEVSQLAIDRGQRSGQVNVRVTLTTNA
ncbi:MAG: type II secretion system protein M [Wenzhouxiangellaceae bacterium]|nr:MAG: type II secretion system protein M [Wenzhouxiangellaceae bacterium]